MSSVQGRMRDDVDTLREDGPRKTADPRATAVRSALSSAAETWRTGESGKRGDGACRRRGGGRPFEMGAAPTSLAMLDCRRAATSAGTVDERGSGGAADTRRSSRGVVCDRGNGGTAGEATGGDDLLRAIAGADGRVRDACDDERGSCDRRLITASGTSSSSSAGADGRRCIVRGGLSKSARARA